VKVISREAAVTCASLHNEAEGGQQAFWATAEPFNNFTLDLSQTSHIKVKKRYIA